MWLGMNKLNGLNNRYLIFQMFHRLHSFTQITLCSNYLHTFHLSAKLSDNNSNTRKFQHTFRFPGLMKNSTTLNIIIDRFIKNLYLRYKYLIYNSCIIKTKILRFWVQFVT